MSKIPNIIFLDIDGVLNHHRFFSEREQRRLNSEPNNLDKLSLDNENIYSEVESYSCADKLKYNIEQVDLNTVKLFNELCKDTDSKVVISSTWRSHGLDYMRLFFKTLGCDFDIIGLTPHFNRNESCRGMEIQSFIRDYLCDKLELDVSSAWNFRRYVIIDDDSDMLYNQRNNFFHVDGCNGLSSNHCYKITNFFKSFSL